MNHKYLRIPVLIGSLATFGFGAWHTVVPWLYGWFDYLPSLPGELTNAILAINFLLSASLILFGGMAGYHGYMAMEQRTVTKAGIVSNRHPVGIPGRVPAPQPAGDDDTCFTIDLAACI